MTSLLEEHIPSHVAIIMDGNGRWAVQSGLPRTQGHRKGVETVRTITEVASRLGIKVLTLYAFSSENWKRPKGEILSLMNLLRKFLDDDVPKLLKNNIRLKVIGEVSRLNPLLKKKINWAIQQTEKNTGMILNIALSYGGRQEIMNAVLKIIKSGKKIESEKDFETYLWTEGLPDPDLLIRTSGEKRLSNFLLWQCAYAEFFFTDVMWPDFSEEHFMEALQSFSQRQRRDGQLKSN